MAAAVELLGHCDSSQLSIAQIAAKAGVSVGGFYARFASKAALIEHLHETVLGEFVQRIQQRLSPEATADVGARELIEIYISLTVDGLREHRTVTRQISLHSRTSSDAAFRGSIRSVNQTLHDLFRKRLGERAEQLGHRHWQRAVDVALTGVSAAMREYVLFDDLRPHFAALDDAQLVQELTDLFCSYLRID